MNVISITVPVYFNEGSLPLLFAELCQAEQELAPQFSLELIFVDDGSGDNSLGELLKIKAQRPSTKVIKLTRNFGAFQALKTGLRYATGDCFMWLAADLQDPPSLIPQMARKWLEGCKFVLCARADRCDPWTTRLWARAYYILVHLLVSPEYPPNGFDLALLDKQLLPYFQSSSKNLNLSLLAHWLGYKPFIISYSRQERVYGRSRWTFRKKVKLFVDSLVGFSFVPIRLISLVGLVLSLLSIGYGLFVVIAALTTERKVPGFPTLAALIAFFFGVLSMMLGVIGEYVWRILDEINKRPDTVIDEIY